MTVTTSLEQLATSLVISTRLLTTLTTHANTTYCLLQVVLFYLLVLKRFWSLNNFNFITRSFFYTLKRCLQVPTRSHWRNCRRFFPSWQMPCNRILCLANRLVYIDQEIQKIAEKYDNVNYWWPKCWIWLYYFPNIILKHKIMFLTAKSKYSIYFPSSKIVKQSDWWTKI